MATEPNTHFSIDFATLPPVEKDGETFQHLVAMVDNFSMMPYYFPVKNIKSANVIQCIDNMLQTNIPIKWICVDNAQAFSSHEFIQKMAERGIKIKYITVRSPQANRSEICVRLFLNAARLFSASNNQNWLENIYKITYLLQRLPKLTLKEIVKSPAEITLGKDYDFFNPFLDIDDSKNKFKMQKKWKKFCHEYNQLKNQETQEKHKIYSGYPSSLSENDHVLLKFLFPRNNKLAPKYHKTVYRVLQIHGLQATIIDLHHQMPIKKVHLRHLRKIPKKPPSIMVKFSKYIEKNLLKKLEEVNYESNDNLDEFWPFSLFEEDVQDQMETEQKAFESQDNVNKEAMNLNDFEQNSTFDPYLDPSSYNNETMTHVDQISSINTPNTIITHKHASDSDKLFYDTASQTFSNFSQNKTQSILDELDESFNNTPSEPIEPIKSTEKLNDLKNNVTKTIKSFPSKAFTKFQNKLKNIVNSNSTVS